MVCYAFLLCRTMPKKIDTRGLGERCSLNPTQTMMQFTPTNTTPVAVSRMPMTSAEVAEITAMFVKKHQERIARQRTIANMACTDYNDLQKNDVIRVEIGDNHSTLIVAADKSVLLVQDSNGVRPMQAYPSIFSYLATLTGVKFHTVSLNSQSHDSNYPHPTGAMCSYNKGEVSM